MSDLTEIEVPWLEKRIENRIRFGRIVKERKLDRHRRVLSSRQAVSSPSSVGPQTTLERSSLGSTSCARLRRDSAARPCRM
jgi:hypothetical protein